MLRMTIKTMWPYIISLVWFKILAILVNVLVSPSINRIMHADNELMTLIIFDPYIITYVVAGFLWGHVALHHDVTKVSHLASSMAIYLIPSSYSFGRSGFLYRIGPHHYNGTHHMGWGT